MRLARVLSWLVLIASLTAATSTAQTIKLATLVPEGSFWDRALRDMGAEWERQTDGDVRLGRQRPDGRVMAQARFPPRAPRRD